MTIPADSDLDVQTMKSEFCAIDFPEIEFEFSREFNLAEITSVVRTNFLAFASSKNHFCECFEIKIVAFF